MKLVKNLIKSESCKLKEISDPHNNSISSKYRRRTPLSTENVRDFRARRFHASRTPLFVFVTLHVGEQHVVYLHIGIFYISHPTTHFIKPIVPPPPLDFRFTELFKYCSTFLQDAWPTCGTIWVADHTGKKENEGEPSGK